VFVRGEKLSAHSARPRKIPGWLVVVRENTSVNKRSFRKLTIEIVLRGFLFVFFFKFYIGFKVVWYPKMDQKVCLNMVKKDQLCGIALEKRN